MDDKEKFLKDRVHLECKSTVHDQLDFDWSLVTLAQAENYLLTLQEINPRLFPNIAFSETDEDLNIEDSIQSEENIRRFVLETMVKNLPIDEVLMADCYVQSDGSEAKAKALYMVQMIDKGKKYLYQKLNEKLSDNLRIAQTQIENTLNNYNLISEVVGSLYDFDKISERLNTTNSGSAVLENIIMQEKGLDSQKIKECFTIYLIYRFKELRGEKVKSNAGFNALMILLTPTFIWLGYFATKAIKNYFKILPKELRTLKSVVALEILLFTGKKTNIEQFLARLSSIFIDSEETNKIISFAESAINYSQDLNDIKRAREFTQQNIDNITNRDKS